MSAQTAGRSPRIGSLFSGVGDIDLARIEAQRVALARDALPTETP